MLIKASLNKHLKSGACCFFLVLSFSVSAKGREEGTGSSHLSAGQEKDFLHVVCFHFTDYWRMR